MPGVAAISIPIDREWPTGARLTEAPPLSTQVRDVLLEALTSGRLRPGDRINEAELARELGISRNPIREAISGLARQGFLLASPRRGHFLRKFSADDINDAFAFRICVESFALGEAVPRMRPSDHDGLAELIESMLAAARGSRTAELHHFDMLFHRRICELSGNSHAVRAHEAIDTEIRMLIAAVELRDETLHECATSHIPIAEAVASGDAVRAIAALETHVRATWDRLLRRVNDPSAGGRDRDHSRADKAIARCPL